MLKNYLYVCKNDTVDNLMTMKQNLIMIVAN